MQTRHTARFATIVQFMMGLLLMVALPVHGQTPQKCDVNGDGFITTADISLITAARNRPASGANDPRDPDNNGVINALDARTCALRCTLPGCAMPSNTAPVAVNDAYAANEDTTLVVMAPGVLGNDTDPQNNPLTASVVVGPTTGTLVLSANGSFSYMPAPNFSGPVTFTYRANDGALNSNTATVTINVAAANDGPVGVPDTYSTQEDTPLTVAAPGVLANDTDPDASALSALLVGGPAVSAGTVTLNGNGSFTFTPAPNFTGAATFTYRASDGLLQSGVTTVTINVTTSNDAPTANADAYGTDEDVPLTVAAPGVLGNDDDPDGGGLTAVLATPPTSGTLVLNADGSFIYTPAANFTGAATFTYRANDGLLQSNAATVSLSVLPINDAPVALNDSYSTSANTPLNVTGPGVLGNDTDQEGSGLTAVLVAGPANGTLSLNANGEFTYTPNTGFSGTNTFTYRANDGALDSNNATVTIVVTAVANTPPVANDDNYSTPEDAQLVVAAPGVLGNDTDAQASPLTAILVSPLNPPASGTLNLGSNGSFTYFPAANFNGLATFTYRASDGVLSSNVATVSLTVTPVNDPPIAANDTFSTAANVTLNVPAKGVLENDTDAEGTPLAAVLVSGPAAGAGALTLNANGSFTFIPATNFTGEATFTYRASDGVDTSNPATVTINVTAAPNAPPVAVNDAYSTPEDTALNVPANGVLGNDTDADGDALSAIQVTGPAQGNLVLAGDGGFTYTPPPQFNGPVTFTYRANDGLADSANAATVTINVTAVNDGPVGVADTYSTPEDTPLSIAAPGVLDNDTDADGTPLVAQLVSGPAANAGAVTLNGDGSFTFTPAINFTGAATFSYRASDGVVPSGVTTVTIDVLPVNDKPVANADGYSTSEDATLTVTAPGVLGNDADVDNSIASLSAILDTLPATGTLTLNPNGSFSYVPLANSSGPVTFTYRASDGLLESMPATVTITVLPVNDAPVAQNDSYSAIVGTPLVIVAPGVLFNDADQEGNGLTAVQATGPANGSLSLNTNGGFTYTPNPGYSGPDSFTYRAFDGASNSNLATVSITVAGGSMTLSVQSQFIAIGGSTQGTITLSSPAPAGGTTVQIASTANGVATVTPAAVIIAQGQTTGTFTVDGLVAGDATIDGTAPGYASSSVNVTVTPNVITVGNVTVAPGGQAQFPVTLSTPAPAGGLVVALATDSAAIATVPASVFIPAGQIFANPNPLVTGAGIGTTIIRGTAPAYAPGAGTATVAIAASFSPDPVIVAEGKTATATLTLAQAAPAGGIIVDLITFLPSVATVATPVVIPAGQSSAQVTITGVQQGTTQARATGVGLIETGVQINVPPPPQITVAGITSVGKDLQDQGSFTLGAPAPAGNLVVTINSSDPSKMLVAPNATSAGVERFDMTVLAGQTGGTFYVHALDSTGVVAAQASAPGYASGQANVTLAPSGLYILSPTSIVTGVGSADTGLRICTARLSGTAVSTQQAVRGGITVNVALTSSIPTVGAIVNSPFGLAGGQSCTPTSGANALAFHPVSLGTSTLTLVQPPGFTTPSTQQSIAATVGAPVTLGNPGTIGKDLQRQVSISLGSPAPAGNLVVTLTSSDASKLLLSSSATIAGGATATVTIAAGQSSGLFYAQSLVNTGTADITATAPGYSGDTASVTFGNSGFRLNESDFSIGVGSANKAIPVCPVLLNASNVFQSNLQLRGGLTVDIAMTSSNPAVGAIAGSPFSFAGGNACQNTVAFDPIATGTSTLTLVQPAGFNAPTTGTSLVATVQANITGSNPVAGKNLQTGASVNLGSPAPAGNLVVTITSADPNRLLVAPNGVTAGSASTTIAIGAGLSNGSYTVQALDSTGTVQVTLSAPGYTSGIETVTLAPSGFIINSPSAISTTTLDPNSNVVVCVARLTPGTLAVAAVGTLRFGIAPISVSLTSSSTTVGTIVGSPQSIPGTVNCTPNSAAGFQFDPVGAGTSTLAMGTAPAGFSTPSNLQSIVATVTASGVTVNSSTVGKDLQVTGSGTLQAPAPAGGTAVTLTSADPTRLLLAPNATTAGTASIVVNVAAGGTSFSYTLQALSNSGPVQVNASAPGFGNGAGSITLVPSGLTIQTPSVINTTTLDPNSNVQLCFGRLDPATLTLQANGILRFGMAPVSVSLSSSNPAVGTIVGSPQSIAGNAGCTNLSAIQFDPVGAGTSTLSVATPVGFSTPSNRQSILANVTASGINVNARTVGKNLQVSASGSLQAPAPAGGLSVTLTSADPARLLLAPNGTTTGAASIVVTLAQGATSFSYFVQGLDDAGSTVKVSAAAPGFSSGSGDITLVPSGFIIDTPSVINTTTLDPNTNVRICVAQLTPGTLNFSQNGVLRSGVAPVSISLTSSAPAVGAIVGSPQSMSGNEGCTSTSAMQFDPVSAGTSVVTVGPTPSGFSTPSNRQSITANVTASGININTATLGKDMQRTISGSLQAPAPAGGVTVTLTSIQPAKLALAPNATTIGGTSANVNVAAGATSFSFVAQALDSVGPVQVTAAALGFVDGTVDITLAPSGFVISTPGNFSVAVGAANRNIQICAALLNPITLNRVENATLRFGITPVSVGVASSNPAAGVIVGSPRSIAGNTSCTGSGAAGIQFDPLAVGVSSLSLGAVPGFSTPSNQQQITATVN